MKDRPSGFLTFEEEARAILENLSDIQAGIFLKKKASYFFDDIPPEFEDQQLALLWGMVKRRLDADRHAYLIKSVRNSYKAYLRDRAGGDDDPASIREWFRWKREILESAAEAEGKPKNSIPIAYQVVDPEDL